MAKKATSITMRSRKCERYDYNKLHSIQYVPSIDFVVSDELVRIASVERGEITDYPRERVMLVFTIPEALEFAAEINRQCVIAAQQS